jgi:hypothetical protein
MQHGLLPALVAKVSGNGGFAVRAGAGGMMEVGFSGHGNSGKRLINIHVNHLIAKKHHPIARPASGLRVRI